MTLLRTTSLADGMEKGCFKSSERVLRKIKRSENLTSAACYWYWWFSFLPLVIHLLPSHYTSPSSSHTHTRARTHTHAHTHATTATLPEGRERERERERGGKKKSKKKKSRKPTKRSREMRWKSLTCLIAFLLLGAVGAVFLKAHGITIEAINYLV